MNKLVFVAFGSLGDIYPLLAVAERMKDTHDLVFLANEYFATHVIQRGIEFVSIGKESDQLSAKEREDSSGETRTGRIHRFENVIGKSIEPATLYLQELINQGVRPLVITHGNLSPASIACEKFRIPMIITYYATSQIPHNIEDQMMCQAFLGKNMWLERRINVPLQKLKQKFNFEIRRELNVYRQKYKLPLIPGALERLQSWFIPGKKLAQPGLKITSHIALLPDWFCDPIDQMFPYIQFMGFPFINELSAENKELDEFVRQNPQFIVFTPGTAVEDVEAFCSQIIPICRKLGSPGIFASKHGREIFEKMPKADDVPLFYLEHANFESLLPNARCLIHHGGIGTVAQAVRAGIPQIIRPRMYDQPANALRVMRCGLGGMVSVQQFKADVITNILLHIETSQLHQERLKYYSEEVKKQSGAANCQALIENLITQQRGTKSHEEFGEHLKLC